MVKRFSRRTMLKMLIAGGATLSLPYQLMAAPGTPLSRHPDLAEQMGGIIGDLAIGLDLREINPQTGYEYFRIQVNADALYPVASCFKTWLALYYFWHTGRGGWVYEEGSNVYSVVVYSNNTLTGKIIHDVGEQINVYGNAVEKFNDFLLYQVGMENGLHNWNWEGNPVENQTDRRFQPSLTDRYIDIRDVRYTMDNLTTAADLANGYAFLLNPPDAEHSEEAKLTLDLCSIPAADYPSPIERAFNLSYTGKDGVLPTDSSVIGRVINDAGVINIGRSTYILSYLCAGEGEYVAMNVLRDIAAALQAFEETV